MFLLGEAGKDLGKTARRLLTQIGRDAHPRQNDHYLGLLQLVDDCPQIVFHLGDIQPAQTVVGHQGEDYDHWFCFKGPFQAAQAIGGGVTGDACINYFIGVALGAQTLLQ
jgi:hypothetical protein